MAQSKNGYENRPSWILILTLVVYSIAAYILLSIVLMLLVIPVKNQVDQHVLDLLDQGKQRPLYALIFYALVKMVAYIQLPFALWATVVYRIKADMKSRIKYFLILLLIWSPNIILWHILTY